MFDENFSFDAPRSPSINSSTAATRDSSRSVSPCSPARPFPPPRFSVSDLAAQFADQRIRKESQICYDSCKSYANLDEEADWTIPSLEDNDCNALSRSKTFPQRPHSPSQRSQRQVHTRLLCTPSHHRDIASLISSMVDSEDQCYTTSAEAITPPAEQEDEGYNSSGDSEMMDASRRSSTVAMSSRILVRRASDMSRTGACVSKSIRVRKDKNHRRIRNSEKSS